MYNSVQMTMFLPTNFLQRGIIFVFPYYFARTTDELENPWGISSHGDFLGVLSSNVSIFQSMRGSSTGE